MKWWKATLRNLNFIANGFVSHEFILNSALITLHNQVKTVDLGVVFQITEPRVYSEDSEVFSF